MKIKYGKILSAVAALITPAMLYAATEDLSVDVKLDIVASEALCSANISQNVDFGEREAVSVIGVEQEIELEIGCEIGSAGATIVSDMGMSEVNDEAYQLVLDGGGKGIFYSIDLLTERSSTIGTLLRDPLILGVLSDEETNLFRLKFEILSAETPVELGTYSDTVTFTLTY